MLQVLTMEENEDISFISGESVIKWKIPEFLSLPEEIDTCNDSSPFSFAGASWFIRMYPNGKKKAVLTNSGEMINIEGYINLYIWRNSLGSPINLEYSFGLKINDEKRDSLKFAFCFEKKQGYGVKIIKRDYLKSKLTPSDTLVVICKLKLLKSLPIPTGKITATTVIDPKDKILQDFKQLFIKRENYDVVLKVEQQEFSAHKAILTARSPVFASTFKHDMKEKATGIVNIDDCEPSVFSKFLGFLYHGEIDSLSKDNVFDLFSVSDKYDVPDLKIKCIEFIKENLSTETFCDTINLVLRYSETDLLNFTTDFFIKNAEKIIITVDWMKFAKENPIQSNELFIKFVASVKLSNK